MSTPPNTVNVNILDKDYLVACPPETHDELSKAAKVLDNKMKEIRASGKVYGTERIAVMAALNLTHELLTASEQSGRFETTLQTLIEKLDKALGQKP